MCLNQLSSLFQAAASKALTATAYTKPVYKQTMKARPYGVTATQVFTKTSFIQIHC
jgi:hypothetical protein